MDRCMNELIIFLKQIFEYCVRIGSGDDEVSVVILLVCLRSTVPESQLSKRQCGGIIIPKAASKFHNILMTPATYRLYSCIVKQHHTDFDYNKDDSSHGV